MSSRRADAAVVVLPGLLAAILSVIGLTGRSLGFDEAATVAIVSQHGHALWHAIARDGGNMSGYYLLLHGLLGSFGDGPWVLRLPSVVFTAFTPMFVAAIGLALWREPGMGPGRARGSGPAPDGRLAAGIAGLLCAVSLPLVYWAQTARGYAGMLCFACAGMLCFVWLVRAADEDRPWAAAAAGYALAMGLAAYCGFIVLVLVPVQLAALLGRRRTLVRFLTALVPLGLLCVPIAVLAVRRGSGQLFWVPKPSGQVDTQVLQALTSAGLQSTFHRVFTTTPGWVLTSVVILVLLAGTARRGRARDWGMALVLGWAVLPAVLEFVSSLISQPLFLPRNLLVSVPAVALALGAALADRRLPRWVAAGGLALALLIRAAPVIASYGVSPEPWAAASARVLGGARPGDCIAFYPEDARNPFRWYLGRAGREAVAHAPRSVLPAVDWSRSTPYVELYPTLSAHRVAALRSQCTRMWFVSSHEGQPSGPAESVRHRARWNALRARLEHAFGAGPVESLGWASPIHVELMAGRRRG
jgi:mannosyltransferase